MRKTCLYTNILLLPIILLQFNLIGAQNLKKNSDQDNKSNDTLKMPDNALFKEEDFAPLDYKSQADKKIYTEIPLEDFEANDYSEKNVKFRFSGFKQAQLRIRNEYPAPIRDSRKYLGIKVFGQKEDAVAIVPAKNIIIDKYCKQLSVWAYGKGLSGRLSVIVQDGNMNTHLLSFGQLNYRGWRKLSISIPSHVVQSDYFLNQNNKLKIVSIVFNPGNQGGEDRWSFIYLDDFTAVVRSKYSDHQTDNW